MQSNNTLLLPSNRSFGAVFSVFFGLVFAWRFWKGDDWAWLWLALAVLVLLVTVIASDWLTPFNRAWMRLGLLLNKIVSPVVLGVLFFGVITPTGILMRTLGRDPMRRGYEPHAKSYWIDRKPPGPVSDTLNRQF